MLFDANEGGRDAFARTFDVCVIGAGPAGITLARRLAAQGLDVALMEAGGFDYDPVSQDHYDGPVTGRFYFPLDTCRLRYFGGTSGHWDGKCRPLDARDFVPRPGRELSGWPIARADLDPYLAEAAAIVELPDPPVLPDAAVKQDEDRFRQAFWRFSPPTRFGEKYRDEIVASPRISLCLNANLVDIRLTPQLGAVESLLFKSYTPGDPGFSVTARAYALCLGGIENPRALLNARGQISTGIGNGTDQVGRNFCDHPTALTADILLVDPLPGDQLIFAPSDAFLAADPEISTFGVLVEPRPPDEPATLVKALKMTAQCLTPAIAELVQRLRGIRPRCGWGGLEEYALLRDPERNPSARIGVTIEQRPNPDSRVTLAETMDDFGLRRAEMRWRLSEGDYHTFRTATLAFGAHVAEQNLGRMRLRDWLMAEDVTLPGPHEGQGQMAGRHHMCATRMAADPKLGVVDADCRVHGVANLYVGGSSVFGNGGFTKPTLTITQLALRLGDHLGAALKGA